MRHHNAKSCCWNWEIFDQLIEFCGENKNWDSSARRQPQRILISRSGYKIPPLTRSGSGTVWWPKAKALVCLYNFPQKQKKRKAKEKQRPNKRQTKEKLKKSKRKEKRKRKSKENQKKSKRKAKEKQKTNKRKEKAKQIKSKKKKQKHWSAYTIPATSTVWSPNLDRHSFLKYFAGVVKGMYSVYSVEPQNKWTEFKATWHLSL